MRFSYARAHANIALIKYFGKRDKPLNLPAAPSLSVTLSPLHTLTAVSFDHPGPNDRVHLNGKPTPSQFAKRVSNFLDIVWPSPRPAAIVDTHNNFPTAAGMASSASGFAALAVAASDAANLNLDPITLSALARRGSGSAARSIPGGFAVWNRGVKPDGSDSVARTILGPDQWDLRLLVGICEEGPKKISSTVAMERTRATSPYYDNWIACATKAVAQAQEAVQKRDFSALGTLAEHSALSMHAAMMAAQPGIVYMKGATLNALEQIQNARRNGLECYFSSDAGPQPKLLCRERDVTAATSLLAHTDGVKRVISCKPTDGATLLSESEWRQLVARDRHR